MRSSSDVYTFDYYRFDSTNPSSRANPRSGYGEIPILYDRQVLQWDYDDVCTNRDDHVWTYLYRSSEPLYGQFSETIRYSNIIINYPNSAKKVYQMTSQADFGDMPDGESLKLTTNPYDEGSACYNDYLLPDKRAFFTNCSDPRSPRYRGDITYLPMNERPFGVVQSGASYRGLITTIYEVNATNNIVGGVTYNYDYTVNNTFCPLRSAVVAREHELAGHGVYSFYYNVKFYKYRLVWVPLLSQTAFRYDQRAGNSGTIASQSVTTQYEYNNNQLSKVYKTGDTGGSNINVTEFQRVQDVTSPPAVLTANKVTAAVLKQTEYSLMPSSGSTHRGTVETTYTYQTNAANHVLGGPASTRNYLVANPTPQFKVQSIDYDVNNNVANVLPQDGLAMGSIWGYNRLYNIATVVNGTVSKGTDDDQVVSTAGHTSYEEDYDPDLWSSFPDYSTEAKTGNRSVRLTPTNVYGPGRHFSIPPAQQHGKYIFSCWAKIPSGQFNAASYILATIVKANRNQQWLTGPGGAVAWYGNSTSVNIGVGWKYFQTVLNFEDPTLRSMLPAGQSVLVQCFPYIGSGPGVLIDEVRFRHENARMTTSTYQPLVGQTSTTNENNVTSYFFYDSNNKLALVKDAQGNILKRIKSYTLSTRDITVSIQKTGNAYPGGAVTLTASIQDCQPASAVYSWNFGDGTSATGNATQTHTYQNGGSYTVTVVVEAPGANPIEQTLVVQVTNPLVLNQSTSGSSSYDLCDTSGADRYGTLTVVPSDGCGNYTYRWEERDYAPGSNNSWQDSNNASDTFTYNHGNPRQLEVQCTVTDGCGNSDVLSGGFYTYRSSPTCLEVQQSFRPRSKK